MAEFHSICVGISTHADGTCVGIPTAQADAAKIHRRLAARQFRSKLLTGPRATLARFKEELTRAKRARQLVIYFCGAFREVEGARGRGAEALCFFDALMTIDELGTALRDVTSANVCVWIDACVPGFALPEATNSIAEAIGVYANLKVAPARRSVDVIVALSDAPLLAARRESFTSALVQTLDSHPLPATRAAFFDAVRGAAAERGHSPAYQSVRHEGANELLELGREPAVLPDADIQAHVLFGFPKQERTALAFFVIDDRTLFKQEIQKNAIEITSARAYREKTKDAVYALALSHPGLELLGASDLARLGEFSRTQSLVDVESLSPDFAEAAVAEDPPPPAGFRYAPHPATKNPAFESGMAFRSVPVLNDPWTGPGSWEQWKVKSTRKLPLHGVIVIAFSKETTLEREVEKLKRALTSITCVAVEEGQRMGEDGDRNEPFGFRDGIATPGVAATLASRGRDGSRFLPDGATSVFPPSELLVLAAAPDGASAKGAPAWAHHGSFLVYRRLNQDVARFRDATKALALEQSKTQEEVEAMLMGRWKDGAPYEDAAGPTEAVAGERDAFDYSVGRCPVFAHTRKVNPRLSDEEARPLFRRGVAFGPVGDHAGDAREERGIHFMCYQSSIERQFETVSRWMNHPHIPAAHAGLDAMLGRPTADPGPTVRSVGTFQLTEFVFATGGEYFFAPSISGLRAICSSSVESPRVDRAFRQENLR